MAENQPKTCEIHIKTASLDDHVYGERFSELKPCCVPFRNWFNETGNRKITDFSDSSGPTKDGFNLEISGGHLALFLTIGSNSSALSWRNQEICSCPFCNTKVKIVRTKYIRLERNFKKVPDGFIEVPDLPPLQNS